MLDTVFLQVLNMSFAAGIVVLFVLLARLLLKKAPRIFSYALWSVVLFRLVCPFSVESVLSLLPTHPAPIPENIGTMLVGQITTGLPALDQSVNAALPPATPAASVNPLQIWIFLGQIVWLTGVALLLIYSLITLLRLTKRLSNAVHYRDNIYLFDGIETAFVLGVLRPKIYLPADLGDSERSYILLHEQTHIKRFDHVVKLVSFFVLALHWFNPLVWIAFFASGKDMEVCCDEAVIRKLGYEVKKDYSASLLRLATGRKIVGGTPLAFGEGDTKGRIKHVLHYKKPQFWVLVVALIGVVALVIGLITNPKDTPREEPAGFAGVNAVILEIDEAGPTMTVRGIDENSVIGDRCIVSWEENALISVTTSSGPTQLTLGDFSVGDYVTLFIDGVQETYPTRATASTIQRQPGPLLTGSYSASDLWAARTKYIGDNAAVGKLLGLLPMPMGLAYDHFALQTDGYPYQVELVFSVPTESLNQYDTANPAVGEHFSKLSLVLLALIDNADQVRFVLTDGDREVGFIQGREWADYTVGKDVRLFAESPEQLQALIDFKLDSVQQTDSGKTELTQAQVDSVNAAFEMLLPAEEGGSEGDVVLNPITHFFSSYYERVTALDMGAFVYYFPRESYLTAADEAEIETLKAAGLWLPFDNIQDSPVPFGRIPYAAVDACLKTYANVSLNDMTNMGDAIYSKEYESFYSYASDFGPGFFTCVRGEIVGDTVTLYSEQAKLTLQKEGERYFIVSHLPLES